jgi:hypothetical protein
MNKILQFITGDLFKTVGTIIDDVVTTKEEKEILKNQLYQSMMDASLKSQSLQAAIVSEEAKGNWMQRSWRPLIMLGFAFIVMFQYFFYPVVRLFNPDFPVLPEMGADFWTLLQLGIGGYVIGRTAEKIIPQTKLAK